MPQYLSFSKQLVCVFCNTDKVKIVERITSDGYGNAIIEHVAESVSYTLVGSERLIAVCCSNCGLYYHNDSIW